MKVFRICLIGCWVVALKYQAGAAAIVKPGGRKDSEYGAVVGDLLLWQVGE